MHGKLSRSAAGFRYLSPLGYLPPRAKTAQSMICSSWSNGTCAQDSVENRANGRTCSTVTGTLIPNASNRDIIPRFRAIKPTRFDCGVHFLVSEVTITARTQWSWHYRREERLRCARYTEDPWWVKVAKHEVVKQKCERFVPSCHPRKSK
jgi:hypothetical protein